MATLSTLKTYANQMADKYGIRRDVLTNLIETESGWQTGLTSPAGAVGIAQFMPATAASLGIDPNDPFQAISGAAELLRQNLDMFGGDYTKAVAAYNAGAGAVQKYGGVPPFGETQAFVQKVLGSGGNQVADGWVAPVSGPITQGFGPTNEPLDSGYGGYAHFNKGYDYGVPAGTTVVAPTGGTVIQAGPGNDGWGTSVKIQTADGTIINLGHLSGVSVTKGAAVKAGQAVGQSGNTGNSTGPHLSLDIKSADGTWVDPATYLSGGTHFAGSYGSGMQIVSDGGGGSGAAGQSGQQMLMNDPELQDILDGLEQITRGALLAYNGDPSVENALALQDAISQLTSFASTFQDGSNKDPGQTAFENSLALGDLSLKEANEKYNEWADKADRARAAAEGEMSLIKGKNEDLPDQVMAQFQTQGRVNPGPYTSFGNPDYNTLLDKWNTKMGVGEAPGFPTIADPQAAADAANAAAGTGSTTTGGTTTQPTSDPSVLQSTALPEPDAIKASLGGDQDWHPPMAAPGGYKEPGAGLLDTIGGAVKNTAANTAGALTSTPIGGAAAGVIAGKNIGSIVGGAKKAASATKHWWEGLGFPSFAQGTGSAPGGPAMVGENGTEHVVTDDGRVTPVGTFGPTLADIPAGAAVIPAGVPPDEAFAYAQIRKALAAQQAQGGKNPLQLQAEMRARATDPDLKQKVMAALKQAMASQIAAHPPQTPPLQNPAVQKDLWAPYRQLTGIPADALMQQAAAQGATK